MATVLHVRSWEIYCYGNGSFRTPLYETIFFIAVIIHSWETSELLLPTFFHRTIRDSQKRKRIALTDSWTTLYIHFQRFRFHRVGSFGAATKRHDFPNRGKLNLGVNPLWKYRHGTFARWPTANWTRVYLTVASVRCSKDIRQNPVPRPGPLLHRLKRVRGTTFPRDNSVTNEVVAEIHRTPCASTSSKEIVHHRILSRRCLISALSPIRKTIPSAIASETFSAKTGRRWSTALCERLWKLISVD